MIYKFFHNYRKSINIYLSLIKDLLDIESINQAGSSNIKNNILEHGLYNKIYEIRKENFLIILLLDLFDLYLRDGDMKEIKDCGQTLITLIEGYGYTNLPKHFKISINKVLRKCKINEILNAYEKLIS